MKDTTTNKSSPQTPRTMKKRNHNGSTETSDGSPIFRSFLNDQSQPASILNSVPSLIAYIDSNLSYQYINAAYEKWIGIPAQVIVGKKVYEILGEAETAKVRHYIDTALNGEPSEFKGEINYPGGKKFIQAKYTPDRDERGNVVGYIELIDDISEKKAVETELARKENLFRTVLLNIPGAVVIVFDKDHRFLLVEGDIMDKLGYDRKTYEGKHAAEITSEERYAASKDLYDKILSGKKFSLERTSDAGDDYMVHCVPLKDDHGEVYAGLFVAIDITNVKKAEEKIGQSEKRFRSLIEKGSDGIALCDIHGKMKYLSPSTEKMLGYSIEELLDHSPWEYMHPNDVEMMQRVFVELISTPGNTMQAQWRKRHKNGGYRWLEGIGTNLLDDPALNAVVVNFRDITERKQAEEYTGKLAAIVESSDDAIVSKTLDGIVTSWNSAAERIFGYPAAEMIGQSILKLMPSDKLLEETMIIQQLRKGERVEHFETKRLTKDGRLIDVSLTISPIKDSHGNIIGASKIARDITEQKRMEEALRESEKKYRQLIEGLPIAMYTTDAQGRIMLYNEAAVAVWGRVPEVGKDMWCGSWKIFDLEGNSVPLDKCPMAITLQEGRSVTGSEIIVEQPDGTRRNVLPHPKPIFDTNGRLIGAVNTLVDITEQKLAYQRLRESEKRFRAVADHAPVMIWMAQPDKRRTFFNKRWLEFTGRTLQEESGFGWMESINPVDRARVIEEFDRAFTEQHECKSEYRLRRHDGEYRWVIAHATPRYSPNKTFLGYIGAVTDITDRKMAAEELEKQVADRTLELRDTNEQLTQQKEFVDAILDTSIDTIVVVGKQLEYLAVNKKACEAWGKSKEEMLGKRIVDISPQLADAPSLDIMKKTLRGEQPSAPYHSSRNDRYYETYFIPLRDNKGEVYACLIIGHDTTSIVEMTERLKAANLTLEEKNQELVEQKEFVEKIIDSSVDVITVLDHEGRYLAINTKTEELYKVKRENIVGKRMIDVFPEVLNTETYMNLTKALSGQYVHTLMQRSVINKRIYENFFVPLTRNNKVYACLIIGHDNTFAIEVAEKLRATNQILEERNKELARSNSDLEQFAYIASHDLQEPLRKIHMFSARLQETTTDTASGPALYVQKIISSSERMSDLINALLNYSRLSQLEDNFVKTDLGDIAKKVISDFDIVIQEKKALITLEKLPSIDAISLQMNQLFHNLISNSLKFTRAGIPPEIRISAHTLSEEEIEVANLNQDIPYCRIDITDNGIGFEQEYAEKIFVIFQRLNGKQEYKGTGIGLAICKKIVDTHRGKIYAEGTEGAGATFHIILPIKQIPREI